MPSQVLLLRHAEKPETGHDLSKRGYERAHALVPFFTKNPELVPLQSIAAIYAQPPSKNYPSQRPVETITPLANALGLQVQQGYTREKYEGMCAEIKTNPAYNGKIVIICWSKDDLTNIAHELGAKNVTDWPGSNFDRLGVITYSVEDGVLFHNLPQQLLYGDSKN